MGALKTTKSTKILVAKSFMLYGIRLEPEWMSIEGEQNELADYYRRIVDHVNPSIFTWLDTIWGPQTIDRFANAMNNQIQRFNSRF